MTATAGSARARPPGASPNLWEGAGPGGDRSGPAPPGIGPGRWRPAGWRPPPVSRRSPAGWLPPGRRHPGCGREAAILQIGSCCEGTRRRASQLTVHAARLSGAADAGEQSGDPGPAVQYTECLALYTIWHSLAVVPGRVKRQFGVRGTGGRARRGLVAREGAILRDAVSILDGAPSGACVTPTAKRCASPQGRSGGSGRSRTRSSSSPGRRACRCGRRGSATPHGRRKRGAG